MVTVRVPLPAGRDASYDVLIGPGLLAELPGLLTARCPAATYAVIADDTVAPRYAAPLIEGLAAGGGRATLLTFPAGEAAKTRNMWADLTDRMLAARLGRDTVVVAVGGGVTGDLAGFVAATYLRGVPFVQAPTSLVAMVDAAVGGKTGVDAAAGKNLVGAFHQPSFVACDTSALTTLPDPSFADGMAEALKHGAIADADYFAFLESSAADLRRREPRAVERLVRRSVEIKAAVVAADEREAAQRAILNFGHTVGHALEAASRFRVSHGRAVATGMVAEARIGEALGVTAPGTAARLQAVLPAFELAQAPILDVPDVLRHMTADKKSRDGALRFALISRVGAAHRASDGAWTVAVETAVIRRALVP